MPIPYLLLCALTLPQAPARIDWLDVDGDGLPDALLREGGTLRLLLNRGEGRLEPAPARYALPDLPPVLDLAPRDPGRDAAPEIALATGEGLRLLRVDRAGGGLEDLSAALGLGTEEPLEEVRWFDVDGDGADDLHVRGPLGDRLYRRGEGELFEPVELPTAAGLPAAPLGAPVEGTEVDPDGAPRGEAGRRPDRPAPPGRGGRSATSGPGAVTGVVPGGPSLPAAPLGICAATLLDQATSLCLAASSIPALGMLYPLSSELFVDAATGHVGIWTTSPDAPLTVDGQARVSGDVLLGPVVGDGMLALTNGIETKALNLAFYGMQTVLSELLLNPDDANPTRINGTLSVVPGGRVGIGVPAPGYALEVAGQVVSGTNNTASGADSAVGGGLDNNVTGARSAVAGGSGNQVLADDAFVGGGVQNLVVAQRAVIAGGVGNTAASSAVVGGGESNLAFNFATVGGGRFNDADAVGAVVGGGGNNRALGAYATVGGGGNGLDSEAGNLASGAASTVGGGVANVASGPSATVPGGEDNLAQGARSLAAGSRAQALHPGSFVWSDGTATFATSGDEQFLVQATGGVGINLSDPAVELDVAGRIRATSTATSGSVRALHGSTASPDGTGVCGEAPAGGDGVSASAGAGGVALRAQVDESAPTSFGIRSQGRAVVQSASSSSTGGVIVSSYLGTDAVNAVAVSGLSEPQPGFGIGGLFTGGSQGIQARADQSGSGSRTGGSFTATGGNAFIYGIFANAFDPGAAGSARAVYGTCDPADGLAGGFNGNVDVVGTLSKGGGSFKIDHPLDPANKYLYHSFVESPDMLNVYNGNARLDAAGEAWVELPDWFEALNGEYRYQLTALDAPAPDLHVAQRIREGRFRIAGGPAGGEVSWLVTGVRRDPFARANRIPVEVDKRPSERGLYLHPAAHGLPPERGIHHALEERPRQVRGNAEPVRATLPRR